MLITAHAYMRAKERLGWKKCTLKRMSEKVFTLGRTRSEYSGLFRTYLDTIFYNGNGDRNIIVYGVAVFVFIDDKLITVFNIPNNKKKYC